MIGSLGIRKAIILKAKFVFSFELLVEMAVGHHTQRIHPGSNPVGEGETPTPLPGVLHLRNNIKGEIRMTNIHIHR